MKNSQRILVLSNNCFSLSDSNGRTLGNMFAGWPKEGLAQLCVLARDPNWDLCSNYYCLEDRAMLRAFLRCRKAGGRILTEPDGKQQKRNSDTIRPLKGHRTVLKLLLRRMVWSYNRWKSHSLMRWIDAFNPQMVLLQFGDSSFMFDIARHIATTRHIPLVTFCTEGYYLFEKNCFERSPWDFIFYPLFRKLYRRTVERTMPLMRYAIYGNSLLQRDYTRHFAIPSTVIYTGSTLKLSAKKPDPGHLRISYLGNLGLDRDSALIEAGEVLRSIDPNYVIDVYGRTTGPIQKRLGAAPGIRYRGFVSYEEVKQVIAASDILLHVESEKGCRQRQLQYGFSTKIADSIASGRCFLLYAPKGMACSEYIKETGAGWLAGNKEELRTAVLDILHNADRRHTVLEKARTTATTYHDIGNNARKFQDILYNICSQSE